MKYDYIYSKQYSFLHLRSHESRPAVCFYPLLSSSFLSLLAVASQQGEGAAVLVKVIYV